jgi:hypothetical protein
MHDPHYKALLIGNGIFDRDPHQLSALKGPSNDLRLLRAALTHAQHGLFAEASVKHLLDGTQGEVLEAIELFFSEAGPEDHLFFYYSGHGFPDTNNNLYLCARNTRTNLLGSSAISDKTVNLMAENSRARKFIFVLDCCHSGGFKGGTAGVQLACGSGRCLITACANDQLSADAHDATGASTFTHYLAEALTSNEVDSDGDGIVLTSEIFKYVQPRVYNATRQTVQWTMDKTFGEAALSRAARRDPTRPPIPKVPVKTESGRPILDISETRIEFRDVNPGEALPVERIDVLNTGDGTLDWRAECDEAWIACERKGDTLLVRLGTTEPGTRRGNIFIRDRGRGGSRTVRVLLHVREPSAPPLLSPSASIAPNPALPALVGWWTNDAGALHVEQREGALVYTDHNLLGVKVGQGTMQAQPGTILIQGTNTFSGAYTGQLAVQGPLLTGMLVLAGQTVAVSFQRQQPWFAPFVS